jgi:hypothetical protein
MRAVCRFHGIFGIISLANTTFRRIYFVHVYAQGRG